MADKLDMKSMDITQDNIAKIKALFPSAVTEVMGDDGKVKLAIDFDALKQELSEDLISEKAERYQMTWPDKSKAKVLANSRINATLRPDKEKSVDFDNTENLYIEGDNLDVLKLLRETYLGKVKMIYIDPPYNTGNDFVYADDFAMSADDYAEVSGQYDEQGNRLVKNLDSNGRFHTDWLNMIYPRLKVARDLLTPDGTIYISIDDNEYHNLRKVADNIFGEINFVATIVWQKKYAATNDAKGYSTTHDYIVIYAKSITEMTRNLLPRTAEQNAPYKNDDGDGKGLWRSDNLLVKSFSQSGVYPIVNPNTGVEYYPPKGSCWRASKETMQVWLSENRIYFGKDGKGAPQLKRYLNEVQQGRVPITWWAFEEVGHNDAANKEIQSLFESKAPFDTPKPTTLLKQMLQISSNKDSIVLDFFSGSATTAHAVMQLNAEDNGHRKFIMVQLPEKCAEKSEGYKAGYKTICDIGEERIRRAGKKIKEEGGLTTQDLDVGFRVLKLDSSNMQEVYYNPSAMTQDILAMTVDNVKADRTPLDLLFQVMLDLGIELSAKIDEHTVNGKTYYAVNENDIIACFDDDIDNDVITAIAKQNPLYAVFKDKSFATDSVGINNEQLFKTYSPSTVVKVI